MGIGAKIWAVAKHATCQAVPSECKSLDHFKALIMFDSRGSLLHSTIFLRTSFYCIFFGNLRGIIYMPPVLPFEV